MFQGLGLVLLAFLVMAPEKLSSTGPPSGSCQQDLDGDGFYAPPVGIDCIPPGVGYDCYDSLTSRYKEGNGGAANLQCWESQAPTYLQGQTISAGPEMTLAAMADHGWIRDAAGRYHLFTQSYGNPVAEYIRHFVVDNNLTSMEPASPHTALRSIPGTWDEDGLWAPHIVRAGGLYLMFYTGVEKGLDIPSSRDDIQRIGLAISTDLVNWTRVPSDACGAGIGDGCVYDCRAPWTLAGQTTNWANACRDPHVVWDATGERWLLFATARLRPDGLRNESEGITVAWSSDLSSWHSLGYIAATGLYRASPYGFEAQECGGSAENAALTEFDGQFFLYFTDWMDEDRRCDHLSEPVQIQWLSSPSLTFDDQGSANWLYEGYTPDPGVNAPEVLLVNGDTWILSTSVANARAQAPRLRDIRLKRIRWNADSSVLSQKFWAISRPPERPSGKE